jgi:hypothetical protein
MIDFAEKVSNTPTAPAPFADVERLGDEIAELAAHIDAATYRLLVLIREFDQLGDWGGGFKTCAHWLSWRTGIAMGPAREKVRVARALEHLPLLSAMMQRAELSYSKARALTRVATPENEAELMDFARAGTASHVERLVRAWRRVDRWEEEEQERERHSTRSLSIFPDMDGMYVLQARLDPEVGALLMRAIEAANEALYPGCGPFSPVVSREDPELNREQMRADAIGLIAERALQSGLGEAAPGEPATGGRAATAGRSATIGRADRFQVVVHVDAEALVELSEEGDSILEGVRRVPAGTSRRIACDASRVVMTHGPDGSVLDVGRKTRTVPPAIRRALDHRDGGCRFPGCGLRFCDAHHIKHWADGGETRLDNLVLLCRRHHRAVHEDGFRVETVTDTERRGSLRFHWPDGRPFPDAPPAQRLAADPVAALEAKHSQLGIDVGPETAIPLWNGDPFDVGYAIYALRRP